MLSFSDLILQKDIRMLRKWLAQDTRPLAELDQYGYTPLTEAAIADDVTISALLLSHGADPNQKDITGGTPLQWAVENNNKKLCQLLLKHGADPNTYNFAGQPVLVMPILRRQAALKKMLILAGADELFAKDYINTKLLGHIFELIGVVKIVSPVHRLVDVDFEGFYLEVTLGLIADSLAQFSNHFSARRLRHYAHIARFTVEILQIAAELIKYQQYHTDLTKHLTRIDHLLAHDPLIIPVGYEGHAITFIKHGSILVKCDRREDSRLYDNIVFYKIGHVSRMNNIFLKQLLYQKQDSIFINEEMPAILQLTVLTELTLESQISGNCSWANVEATIPALFFALLMQLNRELWVDNKKAMSYYKTQANISFSVGANGTETECLISLCNNMNIAICCVKQLKQKC